MSGSELMDNIYYFTEWKPSPGSIYPLLAELDQQGLIKQVESDPLYLKQYNITLKGLKNLEEFRQTGRFKSMIHSTQKIYWKLFHEMNEDLFEFLLNFLEAVEKTHSDMKEKETVENLRKILEKATHELSELRVE
jgi:DNA-binding PadR family transcriptional regulator